MKTKVNRTPTDMLDDLRIYCFRLRKKGLSLHRIAMKIGRDHTTVIFHLKKYNDLSMFDRKFKTRIKEFEENEFIKKYEAFKKRFCSNVIC
ncbi:helix-turn-helix domain-containing protein [Chryseobacterium sp. X308]|uniref:helix-turn-helix domain-containing protein n=1 Tax=Chryseobacterium sp. X308 TaxID=2884873 RepID=UPI001D14F1D4|nr:helix-turn-helix domain-containing protein [Chryseobacterium sp. X308]MCC3214982.1 helix-turn-helix domain-containing protein [Chryseobacterium sp. X308]